MSFAIQQGIRVRPYLFVISLGNRCFERLSQVKFFLDFITSFPSKRRKRGKLMFYGGSNSN